MEAYQDPALSPEERTEDLLRRMTLREKLGQLSQRLYGFAAYRRQGSEITLTEEFKAEVARCGGLGALYGLHRADPWTGKDFDTGLDGLLAVRARNAAQRYVLEHSRLGIPALFTSEAPHGHDALDGCLLPVNLAVGCTFSPALLESAARVCGGQLREMGVDLALLSLLDVLRDPRWGRSEECFGEDPLLCARMAAAAVRGYRSQGVAVTAKHLCAQGETTGGVNASAARIGPRELREIHLPPVRSCVEAGAEAFMAAYNEIDGLPCHSNRRLLTGLLREEYGFEGFVMSDGCAIDQLDLLTGDRCASGALALNAGVDMGLWDTGFTLLEEALARGLVTRERIDQAAGRILRLKFRLGLFERPYVPETAAWQGFTPAHPALRELTEQSLVLLKNQGGLLPLDLHRPLKLGLLGPNADAPCRQLGDYSPYQRPGAVITPRLGLERLLSGGPVELRCAPCCSLLEESWDEAAVEALTAWADVLVAVVGGSSSRFSGGEFAENGALKAQDAPLMDCGEGVDAASLRLPGGQLPLLRRLRASGKPVVTVLMAGRPYEMAEPDACSDALLCAFYPGPTGGEALARLLFGLCEPAGRLSVSLPDREGQLPVYYNAKSSYAPMRYYNAPLPRYGFGCGLGYTSFAASLTQAPTAARPVLSFLLRNTGSRPGWAVPQLYLRRLTGAVTGRVRQLCAFDKRFLRPGEAQAVSLTIPEESLCQWDEDLRQRLVPGKLAWSLRDGGETMLEGEFELV